MTFLLPFAWKGAMKRKQERIMGSDGELNVLKEKVLSEFLSVVSYPINSNLTPSAPKIICFFTVFYLLLVIYFLSNV